MGYRKQKDNSDTPKVLGLTLTRWVLLFISFAVNVIIGQVGSDLIEDLAQWLRPNDEAFLKFMLVVSFLGSIAILFAILDGLFVKRRRNRG